MSGQLETLTRVSVVSHKSELHLCWTGNFVCFVDEHWAVCGFN